MEVHRTWDNPPTAHKECKAKRAAKWHTRPCKHCGREIKYHEGWSKVPNYHKECAWTTKSCDSCRLQIRVHRDWQTPPRSCDSCKRTYSSKIANCAHCDKSFDISMGIQVKCKEKGWDLPKRCEDCRELFKHKPFRTERTKNFFGKTIFKTYNSIGQLIGESKDETGFFGDERRRHKSGTGKTTGITRDKADFFGNEYRETTGPAGKVKSHARNKTDFFGNEYTESTGGSSSTKHTTRTKTSFFGKEYPNRRLVGRLNHETRERIFHLRNPVPWSKIGGRLRLIGKSVAVGVRQGRLTIACNRFVFAPPNY